MKARDTQLGVKPAVVICHSLSDGDTYRTAVDLINKYGIGSKDDGKGVCIVVAYDQQGCTIAPTTSMEGDLTDAECNQLGTRFVRPYMQAQQPDSAMLRLVTEMHNYLLAKQAGNATLAEAPVLKKRWLSTQTGVNVICIFLLCMLFGYLDEENIWSKPKPATQALKQPDEPHDKEPEKPKPARPTPPENKGGSYGGGRSGGGGATVKW